MTVFTQAVLKGALDPRHIAAGLWLDEDDHGLVLKDVDKVVGAWGIYVMISNIRRVADDYLSRRDYGDSHI